MRTHKVCLRFAMVLALCVPLAQGADSDALAIYKQADYDRAIPLLEASAAHEPDNTEVAAALLSAVVYKGDLHKAVELARADQDRFPNSPAMETALGEYKLYWSDVFAAEKLFKAALQAKEFARAYLGLSRIAQMSSNYRTSRMLGMRAHLLDPDDALITQQFLSYMPEDKRRQELAIFEAAHPWLYTKFERDREATGKEMAVAFRGAKYFEPNGDPRELTLKLRPLMRDAGHTYGVGLQMRLPSGRVALLELDTGASGLLVKKKLIDKEGLDHFGQLDVAGLGNQGAASGFASVAPNCDIEGVKFNNCFLEALGGKRNVLESIDGLIGADVFHDFLISIDFQRMELHLTPLPKHEPNPQGYDRSRLPEESQFTPVFRRGSHLFVPVRVNDGEWGLFLLDTGSMASHIDVEFARQLGKLRGDSNVHVYGLSGEVNKVFEQDKAVFEFAHFRQQNLGITAIDLNNAPYHQDFRMSGIFGAPLLSLFRLTIDYRNGLVNFDYVLASKPKAK